MPMKKTWLLLSAGVLAFSCVDSAYDLDRIDNTQLAVGSDESDFAAPLVTVTVLLDDIHDTEGSLQEMLAEADIWLPSELPDGADYVDFQRLYSDDVYLGSLTGALVDEMTQDPAKLDTVADLVWRCYKQDFLALLGLEGAAVDKSRFTEAFVNLFATSDALRQQTEKAARKFLILLQVSDLDYELGAIDLGEALDMLTENLDPAGTPDPVNTLSIEGRVESTLPLSMLLSPVFTPTGLTLSPFAIAPDTTTELTPTRIYAEDLRAMSQTNNLAIHVPVALQRYYPGRTLDTRPITIRLSLHKTGALNLDF
ncbi:MAG: hypothetical protein K2L04_01225 [Alistipes sp.]|nr:hypothetical protein [Alistipes sp.]